MNFYMWTRDAAEKHAIEVTGSISKCPVRLGRNRGSAELHSAVSRIFNLHGTEYSVALRQGLRSADFKSAIQQIKNLRYGASQNMRTRKIIYLSR